MTAPELMTAVRSCGETPPHPLQRDEHEREQDAEDAEDGCSTRMADRSATNAARARESIFAPVLRLGNVAHHCREPHRRA